MLLPRLPCLNLKTLRRWGGACPIAGIRLARERQVNVRVIPTRHAIDESVELAHEIYKDVYKRQTAGHE